VEDNRWLRTRVAELEQMLLGGGGAGGRNAPGFFWGLLF